MLHAPDARLMRARARRPGRELLGQCADIGPLAGAREMRYVCRGGAQFGEREAGEEGRGEDDVAVCVEGVQGGEVGVAGLGDAGCEGFLGFRGVGGVAVGGRWGGGGCHFWWVG